MAMVSLRTVATMRLALAMIFSSRADLISTPRRCWMRGPVAVTLPFFVEASRSANKFIGDSFGQSRRPAVTLSIVKGR